jgi:hypothetical protein
MRFHDRSRSSTLRNHPGRRHCHFLKIQRAAARGRNLTEGTVQHLEPVCSTENRLQGTPWSYTRAGPCLSRRPNYSLTRYRGRYKRRLNYKHLQTRP